MVRTGADSAGGGPGLGEGRAADPGSGPLSATEQRGGRGQGGRGRHLAGTDRGCRASGGSPPPRSWGRPAGLGRIPSPLKGPTGPALEAQRRGPKGPGLAPLGARSRLLDGGPLPPLSLSDTQVVSLIGLSLKSLPTVDPFRGLPSTLR